MAGRAVSPVDTDEIWLTGAGIQVAVGAVSGRLRMIARVEAGLEVVLMLVADRAVDTRIVIVVSGDVVAMVEGRGVTDLADSIEDGVAVGKGIRARACSEDDVPRAAVGCVDDIENQGEIATAVKTVARVETLHGVMAATRQPGSAADPRHGVRGSLMYEGQHWDDDESTDT